jgi:hypothetical protein
MSFPVKKMFSITLLLTLSCAVALASGESTHSRWKGVISCVDRNFYDGGYDVGDAKRIALMNAFLTLQGLPPYDEAGIEREVKDRDSFMTGYESCEARWAELEALARKLGLAAREE